MEGKFNKEELDEIEKIKDALRPGEEVLLVGKQSRIRPGGSLITPNTILATNQRILIRNPAMLGLSTSVEAYIYKNITGVTVKKGVFSSKVFITVPGLPKTGFLRWGRHDEAELAALPKDKAKDFQRIINEGISSRLPGQAPAIPGAPAVAISPLDEIKKLAELRDAGLITEEEFQAKKKKLLEKI